MDPDGPGTLEGGREVAGPPPHAATRTAQTSRIDAGDPRRGADAEVIAPSCLTGDLPAQDPCSPLPMASPSQGRHERVTVPFAARSGLSSPALGARSNLLD